MGERDYDTEIRHRLEADPAIQEVLQYLDLRLNGRQPRYRYWQSPDGAMFIYTTEKFADGKYGSAVLRPSGKGSRSGKGRVEEWRTTREVHHATRKAAKARAYRLYQQATAG